MSIRSEKTKSSTIFSKLPIKLDDVIREEPTRWRSVSFRTGRAFTKRRDVSYRVTERNFD